MSVVAGDRRRVVFASSAKIDSGDVKTLLHIVDDELSKYGDDFALTVAMTRTGAGGDGRAEAAES